ncbi:MAG: lipid-A-disaccharide synthase [Bacteroidota bacterium]
MKYYIIAGEASGDLQGAYLMRAIRKYDPEAQFRIWGGEKMEAEGGQLVKHYKDLAFMGVVAVISNLRTILGNMKFCKQDIEAFQPDKLIFVDYPGFNLRIAKWARKAGFFTVYYISPQIWAWHTSRVHQIKANIDLMLVILPFEPAFYEKYNYRVHFVGHPLLDVVTEYQSKTKGEKKEDLAPYIALLPGSRKQEITKVLPIMLAAAAQHPEYRYLIAQAPAQEAALYRSIMQKAANLPKNIEIVPGKTYDILQHAHAALVTSGTATLEAALFKVPLIVCYKGSRIEYEIGRRLVDIKYISLANLILDEALLPELVQVELTVARLSEELARIIEGPARTAQLAGFERLQQTLGHAGAPERAAKLIVGEKGMERMRGWRG